MGSVSCMHPPVSAQMLLKYFKELKYFRLAAMGWSHLHKGHFLGILDGLCVFTLCNNIENKRRAMPF